MSQEEAVSLFAASAGKTTVPAAAAAAAIAGGVETSADGLWDMATDEADALLARPTLGRLSSSSWGLDPVLAATVVVANDHDDGDAVRRSVHIGDGHKTCPSASGTSSTAAVAVEKQQQQPAGGVTLPPAGDEIMFGWCQEVRDRSTLP